MRAVVEGRCQKVTASFKLVIQVKPRPESEQDKVEIELE